MTMKIILFLKCSASKRININREDNFLLWNWRIYI